MNGTFLASEMNVLGSTDNLAGQMFRSFRMFSLPQKGIRFPSFNPPVPLPGSVFVLLKTPL